MSETLRQMLPRVYDAILPAFFDNPAPQETKATCASCAMCPPSGAPSEGLVFFRPDVKCCTYHPRLPNYLVGAILADSSDEMAEGRRRIRAQIEGRVGVTPRWLAPSRRYSLLLKASRESSFGRSTSLRCPYFQDSGGLCTIWRYREADCSTFFCKHVNGADGKIFWTDLDGYLRRCEARLSSLAVEALGADRGEPPGEVGQLSLEELEGRPPAEATYRAAWGAWEGREEELYLACHARVNALAPAEIEAVLASVADALTTLEASHHDLVAPTLPERLILNPDASLQPVEGGVLAVTFSRYEPVLLTDDLHAVLKELREGETVAAFRARLLGDHGVDVPEGMLLGLHQLRVVVAG